MKCKESLYPYNSNRAAEGPLGRWLMRRPDSGCGRNHSSSETSPSAEERNELVVTASTYSHFLCNIREIQTPVRLKMLASYG